jgi:hypothetical protein
MTLAEQSMVLLDVAEQELVRPDGIVRWADSVIGKIDKPPAWVIELSTLRSLDLTDFVSLLREQTLSGLSLHRRIQIVLLAHRAGLLSMTETLKRLFRMTLRGAVVNTDELDNRLKDALVEWDCEDNLDGLDSVLQSNFEGLFSEYLLDAEEVAAVLTMARIKA